VQCDEAVDHMPAEGRTHLRASRRVRAQNIANDDPGSVLDDLKRGAQHVWFPTVE